MLKASKEWLLALQRRLTEVYGTDISSPKARRAAWWHFQLSDHAFLRFWWKNHFEVAPGVWRSNQPDQRDLARLATKGLKTVLNLRGPARQAFWLFEKEACDRLGLQLVDIAFSARQPPRPERLLELVDRLGKLEKPVLIHCKSGADRTGLVAAIYLITQEGQNVAQAAAQLSWRYLHLSRTNTGIMDQVLRSYAKDGEAKGLSFRDWAATIYDPKAVQAEFDRWRRKAS